MTDHVHVPTIYDLEINCYQLLYIGHFNLTLRQEATRTKNNRDIHGYNLQTSQLINIIESNLER